VKAGEWYLRAALQGLADAALDYGVMVFRGEGVQKDEKIGGEWLLVSARRGNPVAQNRVARLLAAGRGLKADPVEAVKWHLLASRAGRNDPELDAYMARLAPDQRAEAEGLAAAFTPQTTQPK
jgi:hypothetical protein